MDDVTPLQLRVLPNPTRYLTKAAWVMTAIVVGVIIWAELRSRRE